MQQTIRQDVKEPGQLWMGRHEDSRAHTGWPLCVLDARVRGRMVKCLSSAWEPFTHSSNMEPRRYCGPQPEALSGIPRRDHPEWRSRPVRPAMAKGGRA